MKQPDFKKMAEEFCNNTSRSAEQLEILLRGAYGMGFAAGRRDADEDAAYWDGPGRR